MLQLIRGGPAMECGAIRVGDRLVGVDGAKVSIIVTIGAEFN